MSIGKAHETTNQEVQEYCLNPPVSDSTNALLEDKSNKGLMCNHCANKKGSHSVANKKHCPALSCPSAKNGRKLYIDSRPLNTALKRSEYPIPTVDQLLTEISNA